MRKKNFISDANLYHFFVISVVTLWLLTIRLLNCYILVINHSNLIIFEKNPSVKTKFQSFSKKIIRGESRRHQTCGKEIRINRLVASLRTLRVRKRPTYILAFERVRVFLHWPIFLILTDVCGRRRSC